MEEIPVDLRVYENMSYEDMEKLRRDIRICLGTFDPLSSDDIT